VKVEVVRVVVAAVTVLVVGLWTVVDV